MQCLNTFLPRNDPFADLRRWILPFPEKEDGGNRLRALSLWSSLWDAKEGGSEVQAHSGYRYLREVGRELDDLPDASYSAHPEEPISGALGGGWQVNIFEELTNRGIVTMARGRGYHDFKYMLHGNRDSAPLNIRVDIKKGKGTMLLCEPPGNWGKLPAGFKTLWEAETKVYFTKNVDTDKAAKGDPSFVFDESKAQELKYVNRKPTDSQVVCVDFDTFHPPPGNHVITIRPTAEHRVMISTLLLPA